MAEETMSRKAREVYGTVCSTLENMELRYGKEEDELQVRVGFKGGTLPMLFIVRVDTERQLLRLSSPLSFKMNEDKRIDGAIAVNAASFGMTNGSFDYDLSDGSISFRLNSCFRDSNLSEGQVQYMISLACAMVDNFGDDFLALNKGIMTIEQFLAKNTE